MRAATATGQASDWIEFWKFTVTKTAASEVLTACEWQAERLGGNVYQIRGRTQAGINARRDAKPSPTRAVHSFCKYRPAQETSPSN